jgi:cytidine kinase
MSLLVTGSVAVDTIESPYGKAPNVIGGSAVHFSFAASYFSPVRLVAVVGDDFPDEFRKTIQSREIDVTGLETRKGSKTFRWHGRYEGSMNEAETLEVDLNVLDEEAPSVPDSFRDSRTVFLANTHPTLQRKLLESLNGPRLVVCDTMNLWIIEEREALLETLRRVTGVIINDGEAHLLTESYNMIEAGEKILELGPKFVIIKKGANGAVLITREGADAMPAYPTKAVRDPTGAGDSFAGGLLGYLASQDGIDRQTLRRAMARGTVTASFTVEDFSLRRVQNLSRGELDRRVDEYIRMLRIE